MVCGLEQSAKYSASTWENFLLMGLLSHSIDAISCAKLRILLLDNDWRAIPMSKTHAFYGLAVKRLALLRERPRMDKFGAGGPISKERDLASYQEFLYKGSLGCKLVKENCRSDMNSLHRKRSAPLHYFSISPNLTSHGRNYATCPDLVVRRASSRKIWETDRSGTASRVRTNLDTESI
ncbi:hypothetical protein BS47DRAFT_748722 [Hydnum rufescens UP504]|uniref:Uncharacterized protein n=1 Tax=Hydnum rufescens UP504 TaxID=1448309 RepID=A0A9P6B9V5_9AGAM|nr:hypothetical protein BS47DRAFT_748722 [Hydnum rufescens UP504]